jgi:hypothetical protein
LTIAH